MGQNYIGIDGSENFLMFQPINKTSTTFSGLPEEVTEWESKRFLNKYFKSPYTANHSLCPKLVWTNNSRIGIEFKGSCFKQEKLTFALKNVVNLFIFV